MSRVGKMEGAAAATPASRHTHCGQFLNILIRRSQGSQADLLGELSESGVCQQGDVSQELVARVPETRQPSEDRPASVSTATEPTNFDSDLLKRQRGTSEKDVNMLSVEPLAARVTHGSGV